MDDSNAYHFPKPREREIVDASIIEACRARCLIGLRHVERYHKLEYGNGLQEGPPIRLNRCIQRLPLSCLP